MEEQNVTVPRNLKREKLYAFTNQHNTVRNVSIGQTVQIKASKTFESDDMVLVKAAGKLVLAYAIDKKAKQVITIDGFELETEKVWGTVVGFMQPHPSTFKRPREN